MRRPDDTADRFNAGAEIYAELWAPVLLPYGRRLVGELDLRQARRVLEVAAGVGSLLPFIQGAAPGARVVGTDIARSMIALAPRAFDLAVMDAAHLGLATACFDAVLIPFAVFFMPDPGEALLEARRVLREGGALGLTTWKGEPHFPAHDAWLDEARAAGMSGVSWSIDAIDPDALTTLLSRTGFTDIRLSFERFGYRHDPQRFLRFRKAMAAPRLAALDDARCKEFLERVGSRLAALRADDYVDPTEIIYVLARARPLR